MFQFPGCSLIKLCIHFMIHGVTHVSSLIRKSPDLWLCAPTRSLSQLITSFIGSWCQGIHHAPFVAWPFACLLAPITASTTIFACSRTEVLLTAQISCLLVLESTKLRKHFSILVNLVYFRHICFNQYHKEYLFLACCILYTIVNMQFSKNNMVGLNGLEPSTSRLSGVRSNQLSYKPIYFWRKIPQNWTEPILTK